MLEVYCMLSIIPYVDTSCKSSKCVIYGGNLMKTYKIHLIRHGQTEANAKGLYIGMTDLPLSPEGLGELLELKQNFVYPEAVRFFTSPLIRCRQTLEVLYPGLPPGGGRGARRMRFRRLGRTEHRRTEGRPGLPALDGRRGGFHSRWGKP